MIIGIVGTRKRNTAKDMAKVIEAFNSVYNEGDWICSGGCTTGADSFAKQMHQILVLPYLEFPADWDKHGKAAGFIRNTEIAKASDVLIACVSEERIGGTEDTIKKFQEFHPDREVILV